MYAELRMELGDSEIGYQQSSILQGVMMEQIDPDYGEVLHGNGLNPYSQYVTREDGKSIWYIKTMTQEAYENIILPMSRMEEISLKKKNKEVAIGDRLIRIRKEKDLVDEFYGENCSRYLDVRFLTPTAFKSDGDYVYYPDLRLLYGSLMRKYSKASQDLDMFDEETLETLIEQSKIFRYQLRTMPFPLEHVNITGFVGSIRIRVKGPETMARYIRMLLEFGEYSGLGIKTSMGMGALQYVRRTEHDG